MRNKQERIEYVENALRQGESEFWFLKKDGSLRHVRGTRNLNMIPFDQHPKGIREIPTDVLTFFDLEKEQWRCLRRERIITDREHLEELLDYVKNTEVNFLEF